LVSDLDLSETEPPLTVSQTLRVIGKNKEALKERAIDHAYLESRLQTLQHAIDQHRQQQATAGAFGWLKTVFDSGSEKPVNNEGQMVLKRFVDDNSKEELVHAIVVNPLRKRITVLFRGSVTPKDFLQDAKCAQKKVENPVLAWVREEQQRRSSGKTSRDLPPIDEEAILPRIGIHTGFYEYLFHPRTRKDSDEATTRTRLEEILEDTKALLRENPGYSLYITGHSLGGALSTLCGFYAACDEELVGLTPKRRVVIYSIASPFCGNWKFRHSFQELERQERLQHLRIANLEDMVTLLPFAVPKAAFMSPALSMIQGAGNLYKHVGIRLQIKQNEGSSSSKSEKNLMALESKASWYVHSISYPKEQDCENEEEYAKEIVDAMTAGQSLVKAFYYVCTNNFATIEKYHSCDEYEERIESCKTALQNATLDDLYHDTKIVGKLLDREYRPSLLPSSGLSRAYRAITALVNTSKKEDDDSPEDEEQMTMREAALVSS